MHVRCKFGILISHRVKFVSMEANHIFNFFVSWLILTQLDTQTKKVFPFFPQ